MTKYEWFQDWKEQNKSAWWMKSDSWEACKLYHSRLYRDASQVFDNLEKQPGRDRLTQDEFLNFMNP